MQHKATIVLTKSSNPSLMKLLNLAANLQQMQMTEEHAELHQSHMISKT